MWSSYATIEETECAIRDTHRKAGYTMDPHTAVGKWVYDEYRRETGDTTETILVSTASPFKFPGDVLKAISPATGSFSDTQLLEQLAQISGYPIPGPLQGLSEKPVLHKHSCTKSGMKDEVISFIKSGR
jgi:threonine synthase